MSHAPKFTAAVVIAVLTHWVSTSVFEGVRFLAGGDLSPFKYGPPWPALLQFGLVLAIIVVCVILKFSERKELAALTIAGLIAVQYLGMAILHRPASSIESIAAALAIAILFFIYFQTRHLKPDARERQRLDPNRISTPDARPGLILFLSFLTNGRFRGPVTHTADPLSKGPDLDTQGWANYKEDVGKIVVDIAAGSNYTIGNEDLLEPFKTMNIRMPLEAIRLQLALSKLTDIVLIPSIDTPRRDPATGELMPSVPYSGSRWQTAFFAEIAAKLFAPLVTTFPRIRPVPGADFEDEKQISRAIAEARVILTNNDAARHNIDITGGQSLCSVVGAVKCLASEDLFTYVSTRDYKSRSYDFVVETPPEL